MAAGVNMTKTSLPANNSSKYGNAWSLSAYLFRRIIPRSFELDNTGGFATLEATLIFPIVMAFFLTMIWFFEIFMIHSAVEAALYETGNEMVAYSYGVSELFDASKCESTLVDELAKIAWNEAYVKSKIKKAVSTKLMGTMTTLLSDVGKTDEIDIKVTYYIKPIISFPGIDGIWLTSHFFSKAYTGSYLSTKETEKKETIVYVTKTGTVYHTSKACSCLKVTPVKVSAATVGGERSESGAKYYACEYCGSKKGATEYYITPYGTRYHTNKDCQGLKITILEIPISQVGSRRKCYRCP